MSMREALIDLGAISRNVEALRSAVDGMPSMVVVKANGYGHGAVASAGAALAAGADWLGVVDIEEALALRAAGVTAPILTWMHAPGAEIAAAAEARIDVGVNSIDQLDEVATVGGVTVQLKVDTGLGRNGATEADWERFFAAAAGHERAGRLTVRGLWSHLANAGADADARQVSAFSQAITAADSAGLRPELLHLAATGGALSLPAARFGMVRFGIGAYGLSPFAGPAGVPLTPAMELSASIIGVKRVPAGSGVSYGHEYVTSTETTLALVPLGYADGIPRHASARGPVSIGGERFRVAGRVAMDQFVVDVGEARVRAGDRAILFGDPSSGLPSATDWAEAADTINYEIVTRIGNRVTRRYVS
jgi:alanine racemase